MSKKGEFTWRNCPNEEANRFIEDFITLIEDLPNVVCVTAELHDTKDSDDLPDTAVFGTSEIPGNPDPQTLCIYTWVKETPEEEKDEEEVYSVEYEALKFPHETFHVDFNLRYSMPGMADKIRKWAGLACVWFRK